MSDTETSAQKLYHDKLVAHYGALANAWISTSVELDKQILTLSTLGLGALMAFDKNLIGAMELWWLWPCAGALFLVSIISVLRVLQENVSYITYEINARPGEQNEDQGHVKQQIQLLDFAARVSFLIAMFITFGLGAYQVTQVHNTEIKKEETSHGH